MPFADRIAGYVRRVERALEQALPAANRQPVRLHQAMRYATLGGGKRIRPLLVFATGEMLNVEPAMLDAPAVAIELMHAFSLIHDDLPAMDDDDFRRGQPATHRAFDEATAILAADAMQPLAFQVLVGSEPLAPWPGIQARLVALLSEACGPNGIAGGQVMDLAGENCALDAAELEHMYRLKTGRLLRASVLSAAYCQPSTAISTLHALECFADALGIAYQIRDDILDLTEPESGTSSGSSDSSKAKATYPRLYGLDKAWARADLLLERALAAVAEFGAEAEGLRWMAEHTVLRND